jgi:acetolactate synthase I/II/III large subunit
MDCRVALLHIEKVSYMSTVSEVVARVVSENATEVFALMGNGNAYFSDALARQGQVRLTAVRHEAGTVASADAYYRVARRIAVATTTYGPGFTNALTSLADAAAARTPLVFVAGGEPTTGRRPWDVDHEAMALAAGASVLTVDTVNVEATAREAFRLAKEQSLPVVLFIPYDLSAVEAREPIQAASVQGEVHVEELNEVMVRDLAQVLAAARRPLVLAGRGARNAIAELGELADLLGALTVSTAPARGTFAGRQWDLGVCGGFASEESSKLVRQADVVLVVGAGLNQFTTAFGTQFAEDATLIQIDQAPAPTNPRVNRHLKADAQPATTAILEQLRFHHTPEERWEGMAEHARESDLTYRRDSGSGQAVDGRLDPRTAMVRLNEILPANRQVISDGGHFIGWSSYFFDLPSPDSLTLVGTHSQAIGLGLPSAPGAIRAKPDATAIVVMGDGGGLMGLPDLDTVVRTARSAVILVFNDAAYGAEIHQYGSNGLDQRIMEIDEIDFATLAEGFGAKGIIVRHMNDLHQLETWVADGASGVLLADLRISPTIVAPYLVEIMEHTTKK